MAALVNEFTWSFSRDRALRQCPRVYYYRYYGSWEGWKPSAPEAVRQAYALKKLASLHAWAGQVVEWTILSGLHEARAEREIDLPWLRRVAAQKLKSDWKLSLENLSSGPPNSFRIQEQYYARLDPRIQPDALAPAIQEKVRTALAHFAASGLLEKLAQVPRADWLHCPPPAARMGPNTPPDHLMLDDVKVWIAMDLANREDGLIHIRDWKTGRVHSDDRAQLDCYALFALDRWPETRLDQVRTTAVYLLFPGPWEAQTPTPETIAGTQERIRTSMARMRELLVDPERNVPLGIDAFPATDDARMCRFCNFRALCPEGRERTLDAPPPEAEEADPLSDY